MRRLRDRTRQLLALWLIVPAALSADEIVLRNGRVLQGTVIEQTGGQVLIEMASGRMTLPASMIEEIVVSSAPGTEFQRRASQLAGDDVEGWLALGFRARDQGLGTRARQAFERVIGRDPTNATAREVLGLPTPDPGETPPR